MPAKKRAPKRKFGKKQANKKAPAKYPNTRARAIQRMDLVPNSQMLKCVFDETYLVKGNGLSKDNTMGLCFNLSDLFEGPAATQDFTAPKSPYWGAAVGTASINMSGNPDTQQPKGFSRYITTPTPVGSTAPYKNYMVLGGKWTARFEQIHETTGAGIPAPELVKLISVASRYGRDTTNSLQADTKLTSWQGHRGIQQANMTALVSAGTNRPSTSTNQQTRLSGTWSAKKWFSVTDIKDNLNRLGGSFNQDGTYVPPEEDCFLQLGIFDRLQRGDPDGKIFPNFNIRFRYEAIVLCTETNQLQNEQP